MVTVLKMYNPGGYEMGLKIDSDFYDIHNFSVFDRMLVKESVCGEYEYVYLFLNQLELNTFINIILSEDTIIYEKYDFTDELIKIIINNKVDEFIDEFVLDFDFDYILKLFYSESITKNIVLDKICFNGKESLTEYDYEILEQ